MEIPLEIFHADKIYLARVAVKSATGKTREINSLFRCVRERASERASRMKMLVKVLTAKAEEKREEEEREERGEKTSRGKRRERNNESRKSFAVLPRCNVSFAAH